MPSKQALNKVGEYQLVTKFKGYRAREDKTRLSPEYLVAPSQNVVINPSGRVALVAGYELDGATSAALDSGILSNFDFINFKGNERQVRAGFLTSAANDGKLQYRFKSAAGVVTWTDLKTSLTNVRLSFCEYWDNTALVKLLLWVDGTNNIFSWNGAVTTLASATAATVTKQGTTTWAQEGFSATGSIVINGVPATYTGGSTTTTLTGVSVNYSAYAVALPIHQQVVTTALSAMTGIVATFAPTLIGCGRRNQVYVGTSNSNNLYISKVNNFADYSFTSPTRVVGEGALIPLDAAPTTFIPQESQTSTDAYDMFISEGLSGWAVIRATLSSDLTKETLEHIRLKTSDLMGAKSGRLACKAKNHIAFVANDNTSNFLGYLSYKFVPTMVDFSYTITNDVQSYDYTDGSIFSYKNYIYEAIPQHGLIRIYNMTDQTAEQFSGAKALEDVTQQPWFWEAPVAYPLSGFYTADGEIYGHSFTTSESYKLFEGGDFNGQSITAVAAFAYDDQGDRTQKASSNEIYVEGYIKQNTDLTCQINGDLDARMTSQTVVIAGDDPSTVAFGGGGNSLGDSPLGVQTLGGATTVVSEATLPAWFNVIPTYSATPAHLEQVVFYTQGVDLQWELLAFGTNSKFATEGNGFIKK